MSRRKLPFYERTEFSWVAEMESMIPAMQQELQTVLSQTVQFDPYVVAAADRPRPNNSLLDDPSWGAHILRRISDFSIRA